MSNGWKLCIFFFFVDLPPLSLSPIARNSQYPVSCRSVVEWMSVEETQGLRKLMNLSSEQRAEKRWRFVILKIWHGSSWLLWLYNCANSINWHFSKEGHDSTSAVNRFHTLLSNQPDTMRGLKLYKSRSIRTFHTLQTAARSLALMTVVQIYYKITVESGVLALFAFILSAALHSSQNWFWTFQRDVACVLHAILTFSYQSHAKSSIHRAVGTHAASWHLTSFPLSSNMIGLTFLSFTFLGCFDSHCCFSTYVLDK